MSFIVSSIYSIFSLHTPVAREPSPLSVANNGLDSADLDFLARNTGEEDGESSLLAENEKTLLAECKSSLEEYYNRERFLGLRIDRYQKMIDQRKDILRMHKSADDVENNLFDFSDIQQTKLDEDELCLQSVIELRKDIIAQMELLRRRIDDIESKMEDIGYKRKECQDMLIAAADQNNRLP